MSQGPFATASDLIRQQRYNEARDILRSIDSDKARAWLAKIDEREFQATVPVAQSQLQAAPSPKSVMERLNAHPPLPPINEKAPLAEPHPSVVAMSQKRFDVSSASFVSSRSQKQSAKTHVLASLNGVELYEDGVVLDWESNTYFENLTGIVEQFTFIPIQHVSAISIVRTRVLPRFIRWVGIFLVFASIAFVLVTGQMLFVRTFGFDSPLGFLSIILFFVGIAILVVWSRWLHNQVLISSDGTEGIFVSGIDVDRAVTFIRTYRELKQSLLPAGYIQITQ